jgi:hypothetical protein
MVAWCDQGTFHKKGLKIQFFHPSRPGMLFSLSSKNQVWVLQAKILCVLTPLEAPTATGSIYNIIVTLISTFFVHNQ